ncbi:MAG: metallopeptidase TldD-related protein [Candidatus Nanopelagicaceae bacterium]
MISAQDLIEKVLARATSDECIVIVRDKTQANLRWASSTLTTNGVIQERSVTVLAFVSMGASMAAGGVTRTNVDEKDIDAILSEAISAAKAAGPAEDFAPLAKDLSLGDWSAPHKPTGPEVFKKFAPDLGEMMKKSVADKIELFGYAEHTHSTIWVGSKGGLRLRNDSPIGRVEMTGKSHERSRSTWEGVETHDFSNVSISAIDKAIRQRLEWQARKIDLPAGKYDTIFPSGTVADLYTYMIFVSTGRDAFEGQSVFSKKGGGTRVGEKLANVPVNLYSDPANKLLPGSPFISNTASSSLGSIFDTGQRTLRVDWMKDGVLQSLIQTRATSKLTSLPFTPMGDNYFMEVSGSSGGIEELTKKVDNGLLLTTLWYIRMVDPNTLLLTGLTRDGVYHVKNGEVQGATNNFRWNDSPVSALSRIKAAGASEWTQPREWSEYATHMHFPALVISDFNMSTVSPGS